MKPLILAALLAAVVSGASSAPAAAQDAPTATPPASTTSTTSTTTTTTAPAGQSGMAAVQVACAADFKAQCPGKTGDDMKACVRENFDKLSDGCRGAIMTMMSQGGGGGAR